MVARVSPRVSSAPTWARVSTTRLFIWWESMRSRKSNTSLNGPFAVRSARMASTAPAPTLRMPIRP